MHIRTRNFSESSVQHPSYSFRKRVGRKENHRAGPTSSSAAAAAAAVEAEAAEDAESTSEYRRIQQCANYFGLIFEDEQLHLLPPTLDIAITQHTSNNSATHTRCHNYDIYRRPSPSPHQWSGLDSSSITCSMSQGHSPHGTHSVGLPVELAEALLGRIFSRTKQKSLRCTRYGILYWYLYLVRTFQAFKHAPGMPLKTRCRAWLDQL